MLQRYFKILLIILGLQINLAHAQRTCEVLFEADSANASWFKKSFTTKLSGVDTANVRIEIKKMLKQLADESYLTASVNQINWSDSICKVSIQAGKPYKWVALKQGNLNEELLTASGWRKDLFYNKPFKHKEYLSRVDIVLTYLEQNGYPFAEIKLDSILAGSEGISAQLNVNLGDLVKFDTIEVLGNVQIKSWFVSKYLGIKKGALYNEQLLKNADSRLSQLPYLQLTKPTLVYFVSSTAKPVVYLANRKSNRLDGVLGFAPASTNNNNKLLVTGEANLKLQNLFGTGKAFDLSFRSFLSGSQDLNTRFLWPYIFKTNVGVEYELGILKFDSTFLDVKQDISVQYRIIGNDHVKVFYRLQQTTLLQVDTNQVKLTQSLPLSNDISNASYGLGGNITRYDYFLNPRKGYSIEINGAVGRKKILKNPTIESIKFPQNDGSFKSIYDTIKLSSVQYRLYLKGDVFIPLTQRIITRVEIKAGHVQSESLFFNELFRIGGLTTLKGFDEQAIFASTYGIINGELRYLLQQNSNVLLFWNGAWYENAIRKPVITDRPFGFGAGLNFETGAGVFSLYYAVGKQFNNPISFNRAKIHFGFVNYF